MSTPHRFPPSNASPETLTHFSEEDELNLLNCYLQIARSANPTSNSQPTLDSPALDRIETALRPKFTYSHIADKLHRLKLQYHKLARTKSLIKTPHHRRILEIGRSIWGKPPTSRTKPQAILRAIPRRIKQRSGSSKKGVDLNDFPVLLSEFSRRFPGNGVWKEGLRGMEEKSLRDMNEKWVLLHIEEAELKARRAALLQKQLRLADF
ncbi:hypothetical protein SDJN03_29742, partial [Cucurbita argyrosperma subsp. sororia]